MAQDKTMIKKLSAEFLGTAILVFSICTSATINEGQTASGIGVALTHFLCLGALVYTLGPVSGGHFNPAVTINFLVFKQIDVGATLGYIVSQCLGATFGALMARMLLSEENIRITTEGGWMAANKVTPGYTVLQGLLAEYIMTFLLVITIWGTAVNKRSATQFAGWAIGGVLGMGVFMIGPISNNALNPARALGPAIVMFKFYPEQWIYVVGPILGAITAGLVNKIIEIPADGESDNVKELVDEEIEE